MPMARVRITLDAGQNLSRFESMYKVEEGVRGAEDAIGIRINPGAEEVSDVVWRRSKLGLRLSAAEIASIDEWIATKAPHESPLLQAGGRT